MEKENRILRKYQAHIILEAILELREGNIILQCALSTLNLSLALCLLQVELFCFFIEMWGEVLIRRRHLLDLVDVNV